MSELSIFVDESGDFGIHSDYYLLTLVFHEQSHSIAEQLSRFEQRVLELGLPSSQVVHAGPIVRREGEFSSLSLSARRALAGALFAFTRHSGVRFFTIVVKNKSVLTAYVLRLGLHVSFPDSYAIIWSTFCHLTMLLFTMTMGRHLLLSLLALYSDPFSSTLIFVRLYPRTIVFSSQQISSAHSNLLRKRLMRESFRVRKRSFLRVRENLRKTGSIS